jgi:hypothetical protein
MVLFGSIWTQEKPIRDAAEKQAKLFVTNREVEFDGVLGVRHHFCPLARLALSEAGLGGR